MMTNTAGATLLSTTTNTVAFGEYAATTTRVVFFYGGRRYCAVSFVRTDTGTAGVELYTATTSEWGDEFLCYATLDGAIALVRIAAEFIRRATLVARSNPGASERFAALELA